jgi:antirestriction protein ArdC
MGNNRADALYAEVTAQIIADLESGDVGSWKMPWTKLGKDQPKSQSTGKVYRGINWWVLSYQQMMRGYTSNRWATYNQWETLGGQVRRGEKSTEVILWKPSKGRDKNDPDGPEKRRLFEATFRVFNLDQVDGIEHPPTVELAEHERHEEAEAFFAGIDANVRIGGDRAFYAAVQDFIQVPEIGQFPVRDHYYSTLAHEHVHWTGHKDRLARTFGERFGDDAYAFEELVAELGAAFLSAQLGLDPAARTDHSQYLNGWLRVLKADPKAIRTAASRATDAAVYLTEQAEEAVEHEKELISA